MEKLEVTMSISYNKLWELLIDRKMSTFELRKNANIAPNTMTRIRKDQDVSLDVLGRICNCLECDFDDVVEYIHDNESSKGNKSSIEIEVK